MLCLVGRWRQSRGDWPAAARAYGAAVARDPSVAGWWYRLGWVRERMGDPAGAADAYGAAVARDPSVAGWWYRLGWVRERMGDPAAAADAYGAAVARDPSVAGWWYRLGRVREGTACFAGAEAAYRAALARREEPGWHLRLARVQGRGRPPATGGRVRRRAAMDAFAGCGGFEVLRDVVARAAPASGFPPVVSEVFPSANNVVVKHVFAVRIPSLPRVIVHKVTANRNEARALRLVHGSARRPAQIAVPELVAIVERDGVVHTLCEFCAAAAGAPGGVTDPGASAAHGRILAAVVPILDPAEAAALTAVDYSRAGLEASFARLESSGALADALAADPRLRGALREATRRVDDLVAVAASMPRVFGHNDAGRRNLAWVAGPDGAVAAVVLLDWGRAGPNLPGAELHHLVRAPGASAAVRDALVAGYLDGAREHLRALTRREVDLGAHLYAFVRLAEAPSGGRFTAARVAAALRAARRAARLAVA
ncbi:MAG: hypothetical protein KatS3mg009_0674 [Acidimicrobiia bacterium]|nr:MAG: hypothetical protein KatS3mg009_0674 [Acidimicrobiia bacterium]